VVVALSCGSLCMGVAFEETWFDWCDRLGFVQVEWHMNQGELGSRRHW
jgi:hypothetical protein